MNKQTIDQLNKLNQDFYKITAESFDDSRQYFWPGWEKLLPHLDINDFLEELKVVDMGCGNGRFGQFLADKTSIKIKYTGFDSSQELLDKAQQTLVPLTSPNFEYELQLQDLLSADLNFSADLITLFGVWHHLPSHELRLKIIKHLAEQLKPNGLLVIAVWKFYEYERFQNKIVDPEKLSIDNNQLEKNDFILDWRRGENAYRYCHYSTDAEIENVLKEFSNLTLLDSFRADGKEGNVNQYLILQKGVQ